MISPLVLSTNVVVTNLIDIYQKIKNLPYVYQNNLILKQQISLLQYKIQKLEFLVIDNRQLRKISNLISHEDIKFISAKIITNIIGPYNYYATILAGEKDGLIKGQIVINNQGFVGKIIEVNEQTSSVLLVTDINSKIPVVTSKFLEKAIISGSNQNNLRVLYLSDTKNISLGEVIYTAESCELFSTGIPVATIYSIEKNSILARPTVDISKLEYVMVLIK